MQKPQSSYFLVMYKRLFGEVASFDAFPSSTSGGGWLAGRLRLGLVFPTVLIQWLAHAILP